MRGGKQGIKVKFNNRATITEAINKKNIGMYRLIT